MTQSDTIVPTALLVEQRFPLGLSTRIESIRELYETAKAARWDPYRDYDWSALNASAFDEATRAAAGRVWSRRAWTEYTGLAETPALLVRFCLELGREADPKYFLSVRNTEEAWHIECFVEVARRLGGYLAAPEDRAWEAVFNQRLYREALDARQSLDAYVAVHCAVEDGLEYELFAAYQANTSQAVLAKVLTNITADKRRHASFGWLYLESRANLLDEAAREQIGCGIHDWIGRVLWSGYHVPTLSTSIDTTVDASDRALVAKAGLASLPAPDEEALVVDWLRVTRRRLGELGIDLPMVRHERLGLV